MCVHFPVDGVATTIPRKSISMCPAPLSVQAMPQGSGSATEPPDSEGQGSAAENSRSQDFPFLGQ